MLHLSRKLARPKLVNLSPSLSFTSRNLFLNSHDPLYINLFSQLNSPPNLLQVKRLHGLLVVNGVFHFSGNDRVLGSQLVNLYVRFGCFDDALGLFHKIPHTSNLAWNAILRGFIDAGQFSHAIHFFDTMVSKNVTPDNFTYPLVLKACSGLYDLEHGRKVRDLILFNESHRNVKRNVYAECALIDMFCKCGSLSEARQVFDEMHVKDVASWTAMICGAVHNELLGEALSLFREMRIEGIQPDSVIVAAILPVCGRLEARQIGMALQSCALRSGFGNDMFVSNALIDMYCKCGDIYEAYVVFSSMDDRDVVSWGTLISGYTQNCQYGEGFELYLEMKNAGVQTNLIIAATVLPAFGKLKMLKHGKEMHSYVLKQSSECDFVLRGALIDMYSNCGSMREAERVFGITTDRDITLWNSMISGYSINGYTDLALGILRKTCDYHVKPNSTTLLSILPICTQMGNLRHGKEIHGFATRSGLNRAVSVGNSLIDMYCKCGYIELGLNVFDHMLYKNVVTYNTIISAHGVYSLTDRVCFLFEQMKNERIRPNEVTFAALLSACSHVGLIDRGQKLYNSMIEDYNILPNMEHYSCMVDLFGRAGHLGDACHFIESMPVQPDISVLGSLLGACKVHKNLELAKLVEKFILEKDIKDSGYIVLLSNIYAAAGKWNEALKMRTMIKEKGLTKIPGSSWIQLGSDIHKFHARDNIHPKFCDIQETMEKLLMDIKNEGYIPHPTSVSVDFLNAFDEHVSFDATF